MFTVARGGHTVQETVCCTIIIIDITVNDRNTLLPVAKSIGPRTVHTATQRQDKLFRTVTVPSRVTRVTEITARQIYEAKSLRAGKLLPPPPPQPVN
jgi:hypothetical protein